MSTSGPPIESGSSLSWEGDKMFNIYIYDYCYKRGFKKTAGALLAEADIPPDSTPPINARQGLLFEWWSVFWVLFTAKANGQGPDDAMIYTQHQAVQAANRQRQQQANQPMRNGQPPFPRPPMNGTPPTFGGMRPQPGPGPRQNGGPPFSQDAQNNNQRPPYNRPPSRAGTPAAMMPSMPSPSPMNRQSIPDLHAELQKISQPMLQQLKQELGLETKDIPSFTHEDKQRLITLYRQRTTPRPKPPNATPGPSMQPQAIRNPNPAVRPVKRNSTSPGDEQEPLPGSSPKRIRRSPMEQHNPPTNPMPPMPYPQIPPGQPQPPHMTQVVRMPPQNGFNPGMPPGPMMNTMQMGMPGQPPPLGGMGGLPNHQAGMMTSQMMHAMQNRGGGPGGGPGSDPSNNPQSQQYRQPPHMQVMHGGPPPGSHPPGMQGGRPQMMPPPGPPAGSPESGGFNPHPPPQFTGGPPRMGGPPGQPMGPMQGMVQGQPKPMGMLPPPSPGMSKDGQGGMGVVGMGVMSQHSGGGMPQPGQQNQPPKDGLGGGPGLGGMKPDGSPHNHPLGGTPGSGTGPATPQGGQQPPPPQSQQQSQQQGQGQPQSMSAPPQMGNPMGNPNFGVNPMNAGGMNPSMNNPMNVPGGIDSSLLNGTEMFFNPDFITSVASSLDEMDTVGMFRNGDDINFERDFGQWFSPDGGLTGGLDSMK